MTTEERVRELAAEPYGAKASKAIVRALDGLPRTAGPSTEVFVRAGKSHTSTTVTLATAEDRARSVVEKLAADPEVNEIHVKFGRKL